MKKVKNKAYKAFRYLSDIFKSDINVHDPLIIHVHNIKDFTSSITEEMNKIKTGDYIQIIIGKTIMKVYKAENGNIRIEELSME